MKKYILLSFLLFLQALHSQESASFSFEPPGTIKINDSLYIDKAPIDNMMYTEFIDHINGMYFYINTKPSERKEGHITIPHLMANGFPSPRIHRIVEELVLGEKLAGSKEINADNYFRDRTYYLHPVLNVSKGLAVSYCEWRTEMVILLWKIKTEDHPKIIPPKIKYRLPTPAEFKLARNVFSSRSKLEINEKSSPLEMKTNTKKDVFQLYNLPEFTSTGENYLDDGFKPRQDDYNTFRCVCQYGE